jgi:hypothetical protein
MKSEVYNDIFIVDYNFVKFALKDDQLSKDNGIGRSENRQQLLV